MLTLALALHAAGCSSLRLHHSLAQSPNMCASLRDCCDCSNTHPASIARSSAGATDGHPSQALGAPHQAGTTPTRQPQQHAHSDTCLACCVCVSPSPGPPSHPPTLPLPPTHAHPAARQPTAAAHTRALPTSPPATQPGPSQAPHPMPQTQHAFSRSPADGRNQSHCRSHAPTPAQAHVGSGQLPAVGACALSPLAAALALFSLHLLRVAGLQQANSQSHASQ
jgi:hypothetical protein